MGFLAQMVKCSRMLVTVVAPGYGLCLRASQGDQSTTHPLGDRVLTSSRVPPLPARHRPMGPIYMLCQSGDGEVRTERTKTPLDLSTPSWMSLQDELMMCLSLDRVTSSHCMRDFQL